MEVLQYVRTYLQQQGSTVSVNLLNSRIETLVAVLQSYPAQQQDLHGKHGKVEHLRKRR